jgi:DNA (cytosine-5)-methyltransferase 1
MRPRLLDLFCGAGGAARGYQLAGFHVTGVDVAPQPRYVGDVFVQADAMTFPLDGFDAIHASPPCQDHSTVTVRPTGTGWMLQATVDRLHASELPYVIENVNGAYLPGAFTLCGRSFGIRHLRRHRKFLTNVPVLVPPCACGTEPPIGVYGDLSKNDRALGDRVDGYRRGMRAGVQTARDLLGCPWMDARELTQAIPPVYTLLLGELLLEHLAVRR